MSGPAARPSGRARERMHRDGIERVPPLRKCHCPSVPAVLRPGDSSSLGRTPKRGLIVCFRRIGSDWAMTTNSQLDTDPELATLIGRLQAGVQALEELHEPIDAAGTWPLSAVFGAEPEASWGPSELLAHVAEMLRYWLGEIETLRVGDLAEVRRVEEFLQEDDLGAAARRFPNVLDRRGDGCVGVDGHTLLNDADRE